MKQPFTFVRPLHGLRGIAALIVMFAHMRLFHISLVSWFDYDRGGKPGVIMFFVLSAFLLTGKLCDELAESRRKWPMLAAYLTHRVFRIYPLFTMVLCLGVIWHQLTWQGMLKHLVLLDGQGILWAIPVEFKYYFCIPLIAWMSLVWGMRRSMAILAVCLLVSIVCGYLNPGPLLDNEIVLFGRIEPFLLGSILALMFRDDKDSGMIAPILDAPWLPWLAVLVFAVGCVTEILHAKDAQWHPAALLELGLGTAGLIVASLRTNAVASFLGNPVAVFMGEISFSIYLLHMAVIRVIATLGLAKLRLGMVGVRCHDTCRLDQLFGDRTPWHQGRLSTRRPDQTLGRKSGNRAGTRGLLRW